MIRASYKPSNQPNAGEPGGGGVYVGGAYV